LRVATIRFRTVRPVTAAVTSERSSLSRERITVPVAVPEGRKGREITPEFR